MHCIKKQQGLTFISWLVVLTMVGFFIMVGMRVAPTYLQNYTVKNVMASLEKEPLISRKPVSEIRSMLMKRFDMNNVRNLDRDQIKIQRSGGVTTINIEYEERKPVVGNMDVIMTFKNSAELIAN